MNDDQRKAALKLLGIVSLLELISIIIFCYNYFVNGYYMEKNVVAMILGAVVMIMLAVKIIQEKQK